MPHVMNRAMQLLGAAELTMFYGKEIEDKGLGPQALTDLVPELVKTVDLTAWNELNDKIRQWIDAHPVNP